MRRAFAILLAAFILTAPALAMAQQAAPPPAQAQPQQKPSPSKLRLASPIMTEDADIDQGPPPVPFFTRLYDLIFKVRRPDDPSYTLRAPFIRPRDLKTPTATVMGLPYGEDVETGMDAENLSLAHRTEDQVGGWLIGRASDILDVAGVNWDDHLKMISSLLTKPALDNYIAWMQASDTLGRIVANNLHVHAYVDDTPLLLNQGVIDGRYRWLYEVHATLTFLANTQQGYTTAGEDPIDTGRSIKVTVRAQVGRVAEIDAANDEEEDDPGHRITASKNGVQPLENTEGLMLESWDVRPSEYQ